MRGFYDEGQEQTLRTMSLVGSGLSVLLCVIIILHYVCESNTKNRIWSSSETFFRELVVLTTMSLFCSTVTNLLGPDYPYSTVSWCGLQATFKLLGDYVLNIYFCIFGYFLINLKITNNYDNIVHFTRNGGKAKYYPKIFGICFLLAAFMMTFTGFYSYDASKHEYVDYNFNDCKLEWLIVWRFVAYIPSFVGLGFIVMYSMIMMKGYKKDENVESSPLINLYCLYIVAFIICFIFTNIRRFYNVFGTVGNNNNKIVVSIEPPFWIACLQFSLEAFYGVANFAIYCVIWRFKEKNGGMQRVK